MQTEKEYKGSCYIGVVGSEAEIGECRDSIEAIKRRKSDLEPRYIRATKGYEARQMHIDNWYENTRHPFILLLDHDMIFPPETLEQLRSHKKPYVSGFYMRRMFRPVAPVWYERGDPGEMPMMPLAAPLERNRLYPIGASGWGCMLMHRDVVRDTRVLLKGEPEIIEDDMDIYPYDLSKLLKARQTIIDSLEGKETTNEQAREALETFVNEIQPLRAVKDMVGSDIRFPFFARLAGYEMWGDTGVSCGHVTNYPVSLNDWLGQPVEALRDVAIGSYEQNQAEHARLKKAREI